MNKPKLKTLNYYDYHECKKYLEEKYGYDERDYLGRHTYEKECATKIIEKYGDDWYHKVPVMFNEYERQAHNEYRELMKSQPEHKDFWHWVCDVWNVNNGGFITFYRGIEEDAEGFVKNIFNHYMTEFGEDDQLTLRVTW